MTNPLSQIPPRVRLAIYLVYGLGSIAVTYLVAKGYAGDAEVAAWAGIGTLLGIVAASNTSVAPPEPPNHIENVVEDDGEAEQQVLFDTAKRVPSEMNDPAALAYYTPQHRKD